MRLFAFLPVLLIGFYPAQAQTPDNGSYGAPPSAPGYGDPAGGGGGSGYSEPPNAEDQQHGVARLSIVRGEVNVRRGDSGEQVAAGVNAPLVAQDHVQTGPSGAAEIELDYANAVRIAVSSDVALASLERGRYQLQLGAGSIIYRVLRPSGSQAEIDTSLIGIRPLQPGEYRITGYDDGSVQVTVRSGSADVLAPRGSQRLEAGQSLLARGNAQDPELTPVAAQPQDAFDQWSESRDAQVLPSRSYGQVSTDEYGADDLDQYGSWVPSQYGQVWTPRDEGADWAPYSSGHWAWVDYYGWSWIDDAPWGWAPYHYGRWFHNGGYGWCWWPGARFGVSAWWSPAVVGFFGFGSGLGWVALAPFEEFHPWWGHRGYGYGYGFGERDFGRGRLFYRNAGVRGAVFTSGYREFGNHWGRFQSANESQLRGASFLRGPGAIRPGQGSYRFSERAPTPATRASYTGTRSYFDSSRFRSGSGFSHASGTSGLGAAPGGYAHGTPPNLSRSEQGTRPPQSGSSGGWSRFGDPGGATASRQNYQNYSSGEHSGWHSFGQAQPQRGESRPQTNPYGGGFSNSFRSPSYAVPQARPQTFGSAPRSFSEPAHSYSAPPRTFSEPPRIYSPAPRAFSQPSPSYNRTPSYGGYSGHAYSFSGSPRGGSYSAPHQSAPHYSGGGGGGGGRSSGGGGGHSSGSHSGGGGGGHHR